MAATAAPRGISDRTLNRAIRLLVIAIPIGLLLTGAFYWFDRHPAPGPSLNDRAVVAAESAVREKPNDLAARNHLAAAYVSAGRTQDGIDQFTQILATAPTDRAALLGRGLAYMALKTYDSAVTDFQAIIDGYGTGEFSGSDPQLEQAYYELGAAHLAAGRAADAVTAEQAALAIDGGDADALYTFGSALIQSGNPQKGVNALRRAVQFVPAGWCEPYQGLVSGYSALGDATGQAYATGMVAMCEGRFDEATAALQPLTAGPMKVDALLGLALVAAQSGDRATALANYQQVLAIDPANMSARIGLSQLGPDDPVPAVTAAPADGGNS